MSDAVRRIPVADTRVADLRPESLVEQIDEQVDDADTTHEWIAAATIRLDDKTAKHADFRGSFRTKEANLRIDVLEVYCGGPHGCRRPYEDVADQPCEGKLNNEHLIGGDPGVRKKRKIVDNSQYGEAETGPAFDRTGVDALARGGAAFGSGRR